MRTYRSSTRVRAPIVDDERVLVTESGEVCRLPDVEVEGKRRPARADSNDPAARRRRRELESLLESPRRSVLQAIGSRSIVASVERGPAPEFEPMRAEWLRRALAAATA